MYDRIVKEDFNIHIDCEIVLKMLQCFKGNPNYDEFVEEYEALVPRVLSLAKPKAVLAFTTIDKEYAKDLLPLGSQVLYTIITVGKELSDLSNAYFAENEYVKGMLVDAMADACLFSMEEELLEQIKELCQKRQVGVKHRYEAPVDVPMIAQKIAFDKTNAEELLQMGITSGYMLDPVKSNCQIFGITEDTKMFQLEHDCRKCDNLKCPLRHIPDVYIKAIIGPKTLEIRCKDKQSILEALIESDVYFSAVCGGSGRCGKCRIRIIEGNLEIRKEDEKFFTLDELEQGYRLSCLAYPTEDCTILVEQNDESDFSILADFNQKAIKANEEQEQAYSIAIDIGTTTIAISLLGLESKELIDTFTTINQQRAYGADVISRIKASTEGHRGELRKSIQDDLLHGIRTVIERNHVHPDLVRDVVIAGNTTMGHLLMGFSCESLGIYPFTPVDIEFIQRPFADLFRQNLLSKANVTLLPGISTYVGADITAGLYYCNFHKSEDVCLLIDLGTNGEMGIGNKDKIITTSTAAGPAFEGGNITWGIGSVAGAICGVKIEDGKVNVRTIADKPPIGICGTGVIEGVSELMAAGLIDETGLLDKEYFETGYELAKNPEGKSIVLTQKDIREIQLAKAAVRAGVETLLIRYGVDYEKINKVYLAGGFGFKIDKYKAVEIGMLPKELTEKIEAVGNSSLGGVVKYISENASKDDINHIVDVTEEINLSNDIDFNEFYVDHMVFE